MFADAHFVVLTMECVIGFPSRLRAASHSMKAKKSTTAGRTRGRQRHFWVTDREDDLLRSIAEARQEPVTTLFREFLEQLNERERMRAVSRTRLHEKRVSPHFLGTQPLVNRSRRTYGRCVLQ